MTDAIRDRPSLVLATRRQDRNRIQMSRFPVACWRMDDPGFAFDSSFIVPAAKKEIGRFTEVRATHPGSPISIFGHADPTGKDDYNKVLSGRRATAVYALFTRRIDLWEKLFKNPHGKDDWHQSLDVMLRTLKGKSGKPFLPAGAGTDAARTSAVRSFQGEHGLTVDGDAGPATRAELFKAYMEEICSEAGGIRLDAKVDFLARNADPEGKGDFQGCSEFNPVLVFSSSENQELSKPKNETQRNAQNASNRRVLVYFYRSGASIAPDDWPCPRAGEGASACKARFFSDGDSRRTPKDVRRAFEQSKDTFACRFYHLFAMRSTCETSRVLALLRLQLLDSRRQPLKLTHYLLDVDGAGVEGMTDKNGFLTQQVPDDAKTGKITIGTVTMELIFGDLAPATTPLGAQERLSNLGLSDVDHVKGQDDPDFHDLLLAFQESSGSPANGNLDVKTSDELDKPVLV